MTERMGRSLQASDVGIAKANKAALEFARKADLAEELEISRSTLQKFFSGKPIGRENFHQICQRLGLNWRTIASGSPSVGDELDVEQASEESPYKDVEALVKLVRQQGKTSIQAQCGIMRVLDMSQSIALNDIYISVNILERISGRRRVGMDKLLQTLTTKQFDRPFLGNVSERRVAGLEAASRFNKLIVLGHAGVGKTTFLKYLALQCSLGEFKAQQVPMFISLKDFAETPEQSTLLEYINQQIMRYEVSIPQAAEHLLQQGRMLLLLDGLDEVKEYDSKRIVQQVQRFSIQFPLNQFVMSCRIATHEYTFAEFTEVEVADFDQIQMTTFVRRWFAKKEPMLGEQVVEKLRSSAHRPVQELATNPLLLTLLCLVFEDCGELPLNHHELYKEGLDILLKKWDGKRNIERDQVFKKLSFHHKEALLSRIAWLTFNQGAYFFQQTELEQQISDYLCTLSEAEAEPQKGQFDSEAVLKSIEAQNGLLVERARGIYSFSHLSFQEYFTARAIVEADSGREALLRKLVKHIVDPRWREVFLLTVSMLRQPDCLLKLMKQRIDHLSQDTQLQQCLLWLQQKSASVSAPYKPIVIHAFYLDLEVARSLKLSDRLLDLSRALNCNLTHELDPNLALDLALDRALTLTGQLTSVPDPLGTLNRLLSRAIARVHDLDPTATTGLAHALRQIKAQLPQQSQDQSSFNLWWQEHQQAWTETLRATMISYRNIGHNWQLSPPEQHKFEQYYTACCLLIDCLNNAICSTQTERSTISYNHLPHLNEKKGLRSSRR
ncbi:NACHT domain-containing protein [Stenomitos frigidus]|uniref:NTPase (NACHT family) n=1 Tax=Stenomitos frigidus ULC18 TaxID=2107698 RepID=A0A2T1DY55_9CYAN|nr:NACHT domain-containing NTPase [Stenomitos frigidus]PSB25412.1 NTPase (NACHT family) [Stenomitos frigidus ULC18]